MKVYTQCFAIAVLLLIIWAPAAQASLQCYGCHGTSIPADYRPVDASFRNPSSGGFPGNHRTHMDAPANPASCSICHPGSSSYTASHRDGMIKVSSRINSSPLTTLYKNTSTAWAQSATTTMGGSCSSVNCHFESVTPDWGDSPLKYTNPTSNDCNKCHGVPPAGTSAAYSGGAAGSHPIHNSFYPGVNNCIKCHSDHTVEAKPFGHATSIGKRAIVIRLRDPLNNIYGTFSAGTRDYLPSQVGSHTYGTCKNNYCHSSVQAEGGVGAPTYGTPSWGAELPSCNTTCHDVGGSVSGHNNTPTISTGSHSRHLAYYFDQTTPNPISRCTTCHHWPTVPSVTACSGCHSPPHGSDGLFYPEVFTKHVNGVIEVAFNPNFSNGSYNGSSVPRSGYGSCSNTYCHSDGTFVAIGNISANTSPAWGAGALNCTGCHGNPPAYASNSPKANSHARHNFNCNSCHSATTADGITIANTQKHVNRAFNVDAGAGVTLFYSYSTSGGTCENISCHGGTKAQWGSTACLGCHSVAQGKRAAITSQFASGSHHVQDTLSDAHCYQCHWEANSDGTINTTYHNSTLSGAAVRLVVYSAAARPKDVSKYFIAYTANGSRAQIQKISNHCLGCHSDRNNAAQPFGDGKTPKQYAWDGTSVAARYSQSGTTTWGKYTSAAYPNAAKKKIAKALSAHGNAGGNQRGWNTTTGVDGTINDTSNVIAVQCYDCHNSHGSPVSGITSRYSSATGRNKGGILKNTVRGFGGYSANYTPQSAGSAANKDLRNPGASLCLDCHFSATPKLAPLATFKGYTTPWGYNSTFNATQGILGYWDSPFMSFGPNVGAKQRYPFKAQNLIKGGHFGASSHLGTQVSSGNQINGLCTPCHDPHGVSPTMGANQQYGVPLLKGTWLTSPYQEDTSPANNSDMLITGGTGLPYHIDQNTFGPNIKNAIPVPAFNDISISAGLCLGCHPKNSLTSAATPASPNSWKSKDRIHETVKGWKSSSATVKHSYSCSKCHSAHTSSVLPRLMVTNCLDGIHKGRKSLNISPRISDWSSGDYGTGSGRIPGVYGGSGWCDYPGPACNASFSVNCHEGSTGSDTNQSWNSVTPWAVATPPPSPTPTHQANSNSTGGSRNITLQWGAVTCSSGAAAQYYVEVSSSSNFAVISYNSGWLTAPVVSWTQALPLGTWYWRVTARDSVYTTAVSALSVTDTFNISYAAPVAPTLITQTSSTSSGGAISKTFQWNAVTPTDVDTVQYLVEVSSSPAFPTIAYQSAWQPATSWTQSIAIGTWYWRVTTRDSVHISALSAPSISNSFSITQTPPSAPTQVAQPATSYTSGTVKSITFDWSSVTSPDGDTCQYLAEISNVSNFAIISYDSGWISPISWSQTLPIGNWYWRVKARDSVHTAAISNNAVSPVFNITQANPVPPTLITQPNYSSGTNVTVTFQWNAVTPTDPDTMEYFVEVSSAADFATIVYQSAWQSATSWTQSVAPGTWYWRVKDRDSVHTGAVSNPSTTNSFIISTDPLPPIAPVLINQSGGNTACSTAYTHNLQWNPVTAPDGHAVEYYLQLDTVSSFDSANLQQPGWISATSWTTPAPITATIWYWRVKARDAVDTAMESAYSAPISFTDTYTWDCSCNNSCPSSSCPLVYSFNGSQFTYESDLAGPVISQYPKASGAVSIYQPVYMTLGQLVPDENNRYQVKIWESLNEGTFLDEAKLLAVDYPAGYEIASSGGELTYYNGYVNPFRIYTLKNPVPPVSATDKNGTDVRASLLAVDDIPASMTPNTPDNYYILDFGTIQHPEYAKLVIEGWMIINSKLYTYPTFIMPSIEVVDANGAWVKVKTIGMPAGDLKTMVVDLSNIFLSSDHRIKLNLGVRKTTIWVIDRIRLDNSAPVNVTTREFSAFSANLQSGGQAITEMSTPLHRIHVGTNLPIKPDFFGYGSFTRYGDVKDLLTQRDEKYVMMNYGDKIELTFPALSPPQAGVTRTFLIKADLWYKEFKSYKYVEPLPFHGMSDYPPPAPEAYPTDLDHNQYRQDYNTRIFTP